MWESSEDTFLLVSCNAKTVVGLISIILSFLLFSVIEVENLSFHSPSVSSPQAVHQCHKNTSVKLSV